MIRIILFLLLIALGAAGASWVAEQPGEVVLLLGDLKISTTLPRFVFGLGLLVIASVMIWAILRGLWRTPARIRKNRRERRHAGSRSGILTGSIIGCAGVSSGTRTRRLSGSPISAIELSRVVVGHDELPRP